MPAINAPWTHHAPQRRAFDSLEFNLNVLVLWTALYIFVFVGTDSRNQKWPRIGVRINEIKVWTNQIWGKNNAKHDFDTPGAQFGHETAENVIKPEYKIYLFVDGQSSTTLK